MGKIYNGGLIAPSSLIVTAFAPVADYMVVSAKTDLTNTTLLPYQFTGMTTFVVEDQNTYVLKNTGWQILGGGSTFTGGTVSGATIFTSSLSANTISATTYNGYVPLSATPITVENGSSLFSTAFTGTGLNASAATNSIFLGQNAGRGATGASQSNFFGSFAGYQANGAFRSNFLGNQSGYNATGANNSNFFGVNAGYGATGATRSNFLGNSAGQFAYSADYSTFIGNNVGNASSLGSVGSNNIIIGTNISLPSGTTNSLNIGGVLFGTGTYSATAGTPSISGQTNGRIGIGVINPTKRLHISGETANDSGLRLQNLTSASPTSTGQAIGVDLSGNVVTVTGGAFTGGTVSGATIFTSSLSASTISATTYENLPKIKNLIKVAKSGGDFTSIKTAVDSITTSSSNNRYVIKVGPGVYYEDTINLYGKEFISIVGDDILQVVVCANNPTQLMFDLNNNTELSFMTISGATLGYGIRCEDIGGFSLIHKISMYDCDTNIIVQSDLADTNFYGEYVDFNGNYSYGLRVISTSTSGNVAYANMENYYNYPTSINPVIANAIQGSGATLSVFVGDGIGNGVYGSTNYQLSDYASLNTISTTADNWDYGIRVLNIGGPSKFDIDSYSVVNSLTWDLFVEHQYTEGTFAGGSSTHTKIKNNSDKVYWAFLDTKDGEFEVTRKMSVTFQDNTHTDMSTLIFKGGTMGLISGGTITSGGGLNANISAGFGYSEKISDSDVYQRLDWVNTGLTLTSNSNAYIYFNETGILSQSGSRPNTINNIILGRVVSDSTGIAFIDSSPLNADHTSNRFGSLFREAIGPIYSSGSIVSENITPFKINITAGEYYYSTNKYNTIGGSGLTFTQYYNNGSGGWNTSATTFVNNTQFDNNGVLSGLTSSAFTKHTLYVVGGGVNEKYMLVLGQNQYTTLIEAENGLLPTPPTFFNGSVSEIANIYIKQSNSTIVQIEDIRPIIGFKAGGVNASSLHANLLGLTSDDHKQYLLTNGSRAMSGTLNMGNNPILSAGTINNVTIESHANRHKHGGSDEISTVTPTASAIPKADTSGKLDGWISDASSSVKGLTKLSVAPELANNPIAVGVNDSRFTQTITGITTSQGVIISGGLTATTISASTISATTYNGYIPYNSTNPNGYISGITSGNVTTALGYIPYNATNPNGYITAFTGGTVSGATIFTSSLSANTISATTYNGYVPLSATPITVINTSSLFSTGLSNTGLNASAVTNSIFFGSSAGQSATGATNSNFIGNSAGNGATNANDSNFFGASAGNGATAANNSNFMGANAGLNATGASNSMFFGSNAGNGATVANNSNFMGINAGRNATGAANSTFFGTGTGQNATGATNSNFIGNSAGFGATNATNSNFFGASAGNGATGASSSNFFGSSAGNSANGASQSNFMGINAGANATGANNSNFFGASAGQNATGATHSNFMGNSAGLNARNVTQSNFLGQNAGANATGAANSNFFGNNAGNGATAATHSNFFGASAGQNAINANNSMFFGYYAGYAATGSSKSNFIGDESGSNATNANGSNFLGSSAGNAATNASSSNFLGGAAGRGATNAGGSNFLGYLAGGYAINASGSNFFGTTAGENASGASNSNFFGNQAGRNSINASNSNFFGNLAGRDSSSANNSNFFGQNAGYSANSASNSNFFGQSAGQNASAATNSIFIGQRAGFASATSETVGSNNIIIGTNISLLSATTNSLNIGGVLFGTGTYGTTTGNPSILPQTNGRIGIGVVNPTQTLHVSGNTLLNGTLTVSGLTVTTASTQTGVIDLYQIWNTTGTAIPPIRLNVINTASSPTSYLMDLQVAGAGVFTVNKFGDIVKAGGITSGRINVTGGNVVSAQAITNSMTVNSNIGIYRGFLDSSAGLVLSGSATYAGFELASTINQSGGGTGTTRGLYINPTLTSPFDFRAIETARGKVIFVDNISASGGTNAGSLLDLQQTWNTTGTPTAIKLNVTDTASNTNSLLMDLQVTGTSKFSVNKNGGISATTYNDYVPADMRTDLTERRLGYTVSTDFLSTFTAALAPYTFTSSASGTLQLIGNQIDNHHPGVQQIAAATGLTSSGGYITSHAATNAFSVVFTNGLQTDLIFKLPTTTTNNIIRIGFTYGSLTTTAPTSGNYFEITGTTVVGITRNSSVQSQTSSFTLTANTWYHTRIKESIVDATTGVTFTIYDMDGITLYNQSLTTNINTTTTRGVNVICLNTVSNAAITSIIYLDYLAVTFPPMIRGALN